MTATQTVKRRIRRDSPSTIIRQLIKVKKLFLHDVMKVMDITYPTVTSYIDKPKSMTGIHREQFAKLLELPIDVIDDIINGKYANVEGVLTGTYAEVYKYKGYQNKE